MYDKNSSRLDLDKLFIYQNPTERANPFTDAAATAKNALAAATQTANTVGEVFDSVSESATQAVQPFVEGAARQSGEVLASLSQNTTLRWLTDTFGVDWIRTLLGEVEINKIRASVAKLQEQYPYETPEQIAHRIMIEKSLYASGVGLVTNIIPPVAIALLGLELATLVKMQAEMVYQIAAAYGLDLYDPARRGEVLAVHSLAFGSSGVLKGGLGIVELIPLIGAFYGATTNAAMLYSLGQTASRFYRVKVKASSQRNG